MGHVEQQCSRRVGYVDGPHPGQAKADVILGQQKALKSAPDAGFVGPHPQQLGEGEVGKRGIGGELDNAARADGLVEVAALRGGALIAPDERGAQDLIISIQQHGTVHLPAEADARDLGCRDLTLAQQLADGALAGLPPVLWILLRPPATRRSERLVFVDGGSDDRACFVDEQGARPSRADIDA